MASSSTEAQIKSEIARLTATINQHKSVISAHPHRTNSRNNTYVNPNYKPANKYVRPTSSVAHRPTAPPLSSVEPPSAAVKDVVLNGIAFESSGRSLVRKDLPKPASSGPSIPRMNPQPQVPFTRKSGHIIPTSRMYKPKLSRGRRGRPINRNMTLDNTTRPYHARSKRLKYSDKPCPRFTTTGACSRGLTCLYQHDPSKIAICWNFLQGSCTSTADTCNLSHDPTPERTPLCLHFLNKSRCTRDNCPFPHVNVGTRQGVCRDFAVLGYCAHGLDCDKQHVRECPDFVERGICSTKGCKLPHVIRANRTRKPAAKPDPTAFGANTVGISAATNTFEPQQAVTVTADDAQLGDEYISLTFNESESSEEENEEEDDDDDEDGEEGIEPHEVDILMEPE